MDQIEKNLKKLSPKLQRQLSKALSKLNSHNWFGLDIAKLKGYSNIYRVRSGDLRIIFRYQDKQIKVLEIDRRSEKTYRNY